jgi:hypothetical protein
MAESAASPPVSFAAKRAICALTRAFVFLNLGSNFSEERVYSIARTCLVGALIASLVASPALGASAKPLGVVVASQNASVGAAAAATGATVFSGDAISTAASGALRLRAGAAQLYLLAESQATVREQSGILNIGLERGGIRFSSSQESPLAVRTANALVRPSGAQPTHSQVVLAGPNELVVSNFRGALEVVVGTEVHSVPEGTTYRVLVEPQTQGPAGTGSAAAKTHQVMMILLGVAVAGAVIAFAVLHNQSPSIP